MKNIENRQQRTASSSHEEIMQQKIQNRKDWLIFGPSIAGIAVLSTIAVWTTIGTSGEDAGRPKFTGRDDFTYTRSLDHPVCGIVDQIAESNGFDADAVTSNCEQIEQGLVHLEDGTRVFVEIAQYPKTNDFDVIALPDARKGG